MSATPPTVTRGLTGRIVARIGLLAGLVIATLVRLPHLRFVPIWDSRQYWDQCIQPALLAPFDPIAFNCFGHRSMLYMLAVSWPQYFNHGSAVLLNLANLALALIVIACFYRVVTLLFPPREDASSGMEAGLLTLLFCVMPIWTAASMNLSPDSGVLVGFLLVLALLLGGQRKWAVVAGFFLVLSKEVGLLLWILLVAIETGLALVAPQARDSRRRIIVSRLMYILPAIAYVATGMALRAQSKPATWPIAAREPSLIRMFLTLDLTAPHFGAYIADIFALNFAWLMTIVIVVWLIACVAAILGRTPVPLPEGIDRPRAVLLAILTPAVLYVVTRYPTFNNARYLLAAFPLVVVAFGAAAKSVVRSVPLRSAIYVAAAALQLASMWATVDPVSRLVFGTFPFGDHAMLEMNSIRGECCGRGRDQLIYNLQFTHFDYVQDEIFATLRPRDGEVMAVSRALNWFLVGPLDRTTYDRTLRNIDVVQPKIITLRDIALGTPLPPRMRYIAFANADNRAELRLFSRAYVIHRPIVFDEHGYRAAVFDMERKVIALPQTPGVPAASTSTGPRAARP